MQPLHALSQQMQAYGLQCATVWEVDRALVLLSRCGEEADVERFNGRPLSEMFHGSPFVNRVLAAHRLALSGQPVGYDVERDGRWYRCQLMPRWEGGEVVGVVGRSLPLPPTVIGEAPEGVGVTPEQVEVIGELRRDVPLADAVAGDRVIFRPGHQDPSRECVVLHTSEGSLFVDAIQDGSLEIIAVRPAALARDARRWLRRQLQRPLGRLALLK